MVTLSPITLTGSAQVLQLPTLLPVPDRVRLANESPYALQLQQGGYSWWLDPWSVDVFPLAPQGPSLYLVPSSLGSQPTVSPSASLLITLAQPGEELPGTYPMSLGRQVATYQVQQLQATLSFAPAGGAQSVPLPAGLRSVTAVFALPSGVSLTGATFVGHQSGLDYIDVTSSITGPFTVAFVGIALAPALDSSLDVTVSGLSGGSVQIQVLVSLVNDAVFVQAATPLPVTLGSGTLQVQTVLDLEPSVVSFIESLAAGATAVLIAAVAGKTIRLYDLLLALQAPPSTTKQVVLQDTSGFQLLPVPGDVAGPFPFNFRGARVGAGLGVQVQNQAAASTEVVVGALGYTQA